MSARPSPKLAFEFVHHKRDLAKREVQINWRQEWEENQPVLGSLFPSPCPCLSRRSSCSQSPGASLQPFRPSMRLRLSCLRVSAGSVLRSSSEWRSRRICAPRQCSPAVMPVPWMSRPRQPGECLIHLFQFILLRVLVLVCFLCLPVERLGCEL